MQKTCPQCSTSFNIPSEDLEFYKKISPQFQGKTYTIPAPQLCPDCRCQRRFTFRNFFHLYHRKCDLSGKKIISMYDTDAPFPVYEMHEWWSDKWDERTYGKDIDFTKNFFPQFQELYHTVPQMGIVNTMCENTDYCNMSFGSKNCYLVFGNVRNEDCLYGHIVWSSENCCDCLYTYRSKHCYQCTDCVDCYSVFFSINAERCSNSLFLRDCFNCKNCFGCVGLKGKEYCIFNKQYTKEEYEKKIQSFNSGSYKKVQQAFAQMEKLRSSHIVKNYHGFQCENITGDYLYNCKNVYNAFDAKNCEDSKYIATVESFSDCYDCNYSPWTNQYSYESIAVSGYNLLFSHNCVNDSSHLIYCDNCYSSKDSFGCIGLRSKQYCIFNKQYTKEQYEQLVPKIITHMQNTKEWGEFFPVGFSAFGYNETMAQEYFPLSKENVHAKNWRWKEKDNASQKYKGPHVDLADHISEISDDILKQILVCEETGKAYKIIPKELEFYKNYNLPIPRVCPDQRHKNRMMNRNPRKLVQRTCSHCNNLMQTTYTPDRPETVLCEKCYLQKMN